MSDKKFLYFLVPLLAIVGSFVYIGGSVDAAGSGKAFGGKITKTTSQQIQEVEDSGYSCMVIGDTIDIQSAKRGGPTSLMIPASVQNKNQGVQIKQGQHILGLYSGKQEITCIYDGYPPSETTVTLDKVTMYGTSKK